MTDSSVEHGSGADFQEACSVNTSLLVRLKANSPESWRRLIYLFGPVVYQWCRQSGLQAADAHDIGQETFRAVAARIGNFRRTQPKDTFRGWLWTITKSKIADHWRSRRKHPQATGGSTAQIKLADLPTAESAESTPPPQPETPLQPETPASLHRRGLELIQGEFAERTWKAFWRVAVDGCTPADVADELGLSVNSVYLAKSRVLRRLREELGDLLD